MIEITEGNLDAADVDASPDLVLADAGYCSEANLTWIAETESNVLVATGRIKNGERVPDARGADPAERHPTRTHGQEARDQTGAGRLRQTQGHHRARLRPDEGPTISRTPPASRVGGGSVRVDAARHLPQPPQAGHRHPRGTTRGLLRPNAPLLEPHPTTIGCLRWSPAGCRRSRFPTGVRPRALAGATSLEL